MGDSIENRNEFKKNDVLDAVDAVIAQKSMIPKSLAELEKTSGYSHSTIWRMFGTSEEVIREWIARKNREVMNELSQCSAESQCVCLLREVTAINVQKLQTVGNEQLGWEWIAGQIARLVQAFLPRIMELRGVSSSEHLDWQSEILTAMLLWQAATGTVWSEAEFTAFIDAMLEQDLFCTEKKRFPE